MGDQPATSLEACTADAATPPCASGDLQQKVLPYKRICKLEFDVLEEFSMIWEQKHPCTRLATTNSSNYVR